MPTDDRLQALLDRAALIDVLSTYATGLDARDWVLWRSVFLDEVVFDLSSWSGQAPRKLETDRVVAAQAKIFAELSVTQHFITNHRITLDYHGNKDRARVVAHMRAEHWLDDSPEHPQREGTQRYTMFGYYDDKLVRTPAGWKIAEMQLNVTRTEGNRYAMDEATRRMRARRDKEQKEAR